MELGYILTSTNDRLIVTNLFGNLERSTLSGLPLGTVGGTATGEIALKTLIIGSAGSSSELSLGQVGGFTATPSSNFTRPADTTAYAIGDMVANNATGADVVPMSFDATRFDAGSCLIRRAKLHKSGSNVTNAIFRLHLYSADIANVSSGDNQAFSTDGVANWLGAIDIAVTQVFTDGTSGIGIPNSSPEIEVKLSASTLIYGLLEARGAYTPADSEVFTVTLGILQD